MVMMVLMFVVIYFMMIRPQQKRQKEQDAFLKALKNGDKVVTSGGIYGTVSGLTGDVVTLEIAKNTRIRITRSQIAGAQRKAEGSDAEAGAKKKAKAS
jgi:preprotein translocase subunit YajC